MTAQPIPSERLDVETTVQINEFTIRHPESEDSVVYREGDEEFEARGTDSGRLLIRLGVDGQWTIVAVDRAQTACLTLVERSITALTEIKEQLERMAPEESRRGRCLANGDWGRCLSREGHEHEHRFPTEAQWRSLEGFPA